MELLNFKQFIEEEKRGTLHVVDIDDTLFHTTARVRVRNAKNKIIRYLSTSEYNNYKLKPGQKYDFKEFKNAKKFRNESKPITPMINKMKKMHKNPNSKVIINTARSDFDNKHEFLNTFRDQGVDIDKIHVHRTGNDKSDKPVGEKKNDVVRNYLNKGDYRHVTMYDDDKNNLKSFLGLKKEYPHVQFNAHHVQPNGSIKRYKEEE